MSKKQPPEIVAFKTTMRTGVEHALRAGKLERQNENRIQKANAARRKGNETQSQKAQERYKEIRDEFEEQTGRTKTEAAAKTKYEYWEIQRAFRAINKPIPKPKKH